MARIAIGGFQHETNTFSSQRATLRDFLVGGGWPGLLEGQAVIDVTAPINLPIAGAIAALRSLGHEIVPLLWTAATPSGRVENDAFEYITTRFEEALDTAGPLDALYLDLHGAMCTVSHDDGDGAFLQRIRAHLDERCFVVASLDLHANVSPMMFEQTDVLVGYRSYPHIDMHETGMRTIDVLHQMLHRGRRPAKAMRLLDFLVPLTSQCTLSQPNERLVAHMEDMDRTEGLHALSWTGGFSLADIEDCGQCVLAYAQDQETADAIASRLACEIEQAEPEFATEIWDEDAAAAWAVQAPARSDGPIILADTQDNPGGGGTSDTVGLIRALLKAGANDAVVAIVHDPDAAARAHEAGEGASVTLALGGRAVAERAAAPLDERYTVVRTTDGRCTGTGPMWLGSPIDLGKVAVLKTGGIRIIVSSNKMQAADQSVFFHVGIDPSQVPILVLKSSVHFRADFQSLASEILMVASPGLVTARIEALQYTHLRENMRLCSGAS